MHRWITPEQNEIKSSSIMGLIIKYVIIRIKKHLLRLYYFCTLGSISGNNKD